MNYKEKLSKLGVLVPNILLPNKNINLSKYAVLACDQYAAQLDYWERVKKYVGSEPSTLNMILPEAFLLNGDNDYSSRNRYMEKYLEDGTLESIGEAMVFTLRKTPDGTRRGLVCAFDLEEYDYEPGKRNLIKVTERTDMSRVIPRIEIRKNAQIELPHILMLVIDKTDRLMSVLEENVKNDSMEKLYDFDLFEKGGHICGYKINKEDLLQKIADSLYEIYEENQKLFSFAVGDGNHSIATAKAYWDSIKNDLQPDERENHPARYVLGEIINLYDKAMPYECMNRLLTNVENVNNAYFEMGIDPKNLPSLQKLQPILDSWLKKHPECKLEYIHDADTCRTLGNNPNCIAFCYTNFDRESVLETIKNNSVFVRKSFSMGHPEEKKFYIEGRKIR